MKKFLLYIVFILGLFNATFVGASEVQSKADELLNNLIPNYDNNYEVRSFVKEEQETPKSLITSNTDFFLLFAMPSIIDKLYQGDNIHKDITFNTLENSAWEGKIRSNQVWATIQN